MDKIDLLILSYLKENARMSASDISKEINFSISSVIERIKKLEKNGIIEKYTIQLNEKKLGNDIIALLEVKIENPKYYDNFTNMVLMSKNILSCYYLAGDYDFLLKVKTNSSESLEKIHRLIREIDGVKSIKTHFALKEIKCETSSLPDEE